MLITCPHCATSYEIATAKLGSEGRSVRCARCQAEWLAKAPAPAFDDSSWTVRERDSGQPAPIERSGLSAFPFDAIPAAYDESPRVDDGLEQPSEITDAPPLAPVLEELPAEIDPGADAAPVDIESMAARRPHVVHAPARARRRGGPRPGLVLVALAAILAGLIGWRAEVVRLLPQTAPLFSAIGLPVNLRGLVFEDLKVAGETQDNVPVLVVAGNIRNITGHAVAVPRLRFALRNAAGLEVYAWTVLPGSAVLGPHATLPFRSRLASPPGDTKDVLVRFFSRHDLEGH